MFENKVKYHHFEFYAKMAKHVHLMGDSFHQAHANVHTDDRNM